MKIQYVSDLHLEQYKIGGDYSKIIEPVGDILCLLGDVCPIVKEHIWIPFLKWLNSNFKRILFVFGNHEFFITDSNNIISIDELKLLFTDLAKTYCPSVIILDNQSYTEKI